MLRESLHIDTSPHVLAQREVPRAVGQQVVHLLIVHLHVAALAGSGGSVSVATTAQRHGVKGGSEQVSLVALILDIATSTGIALTGLLTKCWWRVC